MKNIVKMLSLVLVAGTMFVSCGDPTDDPIDPINPTTYTVTVNSNDATLGTVTISPLQATYQKGDVVTITATPNDNANFLNWNGNITENPYTYTVNENMVFTANFEAKPVASWNATFNGTPLDIAGYHESFYSDQYADNYGVYLWVFACAKNLADETHVQLPYIVYQYETTTAGAFASSDALDFFQYQGYTLGDQQYGDWEPLNIDDVSLNITTIDMTAMTMSATLSATMYSLTDINEDATGTLTPETATHGQLALTFNNMNFERLSSKSSNPKSLLVHKAIAR